MFVVLDKKPFPIKGKPMLFKAKYIEVYYKKNVLYLYNTIRRVWFVFGNIDSYNEVTFSITLNNNLKKEHYIDDEKEFFFKERDLRAFDIIKRRLITLGILERVE